mgnify:CR=1 FL=1
MPRLRKNPPGVDPKLLIKDAARAVGGGGGGKGDIATAGGKDVSAIPAALELAAQAIVEAVAAGA